MPPINNVDRNGGDFLFPIILTTLNWGEGVISMVVSIIFAPDCSSVIAILRVENIQNVHLQVSAELTGYASRPPSWASKLRVSCSS